MTKRKTRNEKPQGRLVETGVRPVGMALLSLACAGLLSGFATGADLSPRGGGIIFPAPLSELGRPA